MNYSPNPTLAAIHAVPGRALGMWALIMSFPVPIVGLVLGVFAIMQSRRAGVSNGLATAAIAVSAALIVGAAITTVAIWG